MWIIGHMDIGVFATKGSALEVVEKRIGMAYSRYQGTSFCNASKRQIVFCVKPASYGMFHSKSSNFLK